MDTLSKTVTAQATKTPDIAPLAKQLGLELEPGLEPIAVVEVSRLLDVARQLKAQGFMLLDCIGADYSKYPDPKPSRFSVLYNIYHPVDRRRVFLRVWLPADYCPSLYPVWRAANYIERETYDLMGITFEGHPDLTKVLTPDDLEGHPLRKDFPIGESPTLFRDGRFIDPPTFRAALSGKQAGLTGWRGEFRRGDRQELDDRVPPVMPAGGPK